MPIKKYHALFSIIIAISFLTLTLFLGRGLINDYYKDHFEYGDGIYFRGQLTPVQESKGFVSLALGAVSTISACKFFPNKISDFYDETNFESDNPSCMVWKAIPPYKGFDLNNHRPIWIDPWGRPYQIRYDLERGKLQVRSQGRYLWTESDDIVGETPFLGKDYPKDGLPLYVEMLERCKTVPKDDMSCIFNRGWH